MTVLTKKSGTARGQGFRIDGLSPKRKLNGGRDGWMDLRVPWSQNSISPIMPKIPQSRSHDDTVYQTVDAGNGDLPRGVGVQAGLRCEG